MSKPSNPKGVYEKCKGSGVWYIRWCDANGDVKRKMIGPKKEAIKAVEQLRVLARLERLSPELVPDSTRPKRLDAVMEFQNSTSRNKPRTKNQEAIQRRIWTRAFPGIYLHQVTPAKLEAWIARRRAEVAPATVNRSLAYLKRTFNIAIKHGWWGKVNPVTRVDMLRENNTRDRYLSPEEMRAILAKCDPEPAAIIEIAVQTGMRQSEQFSLKRQDIDLEAGLARLGDSKSGQSQHVQLNARALELFTKILSSHDSEWVFPSAAARHKSKRLCPRHFKLKYYDPILTELGIEDANWHTLRHTFASWLRLSGVDLKTISELCRHTTQRTTERYAHLNADNRRAAANSIVSLSQPVTKTTRGLRLVKA